MKSNVKTFTYAKADGTVATRTVFVIAESNDYIRGLDFAYLSDDEQRKVQKNLADHEISGVVTFGRGGTDHKIEGFDESWKGAFRTFKKENIR